MKKLLFVFLVFKQVFVAASATTVVDVPTVHTDLDEAFAVAKLQKIEFYNPLSTTVSFEMLSKHVALLEPKESRVINSTSSFMFYDTGANQEFPTIKLKSRLTNQSQSLVPQKTTVSLAPGQRLAIEVPFPHFVSGLKAAIGQALPSFAWDIADDRISVALGIDSMTGPISQKFVGTPEDITRQLNLYKKYFMNDGAYTQNQVLQDFLGQSPGVTDSKRAEEIVVTLTSYPARFETTWLAIESLLRQTERPDRVNLNLFGGEFPGRVLPWFIRQQMKRGLEVNWCPENLKVYLKFIPTIQKFPGAAVVAVDDDVPYPKDRLKNLIAGYKKYPGHVICCDGRIVRTCKQHVLPVNAWDFTGFYPSSDSCEPSTNIIPEGVGGVLIPPRFLYQDFARQDLFSSLCPTDDDLWLYAMTVVSGNKVARIKRVSQPLLFLDGSQEVESCLWKINWANRSEKLTQYFFKIYEYYRLSKLFDGKICSREHLDDCAAYATLPMSVGTLTEKFSDIYQRDEWGGGSGPGAFAVNTHAYRSELQKFFNRGDIESIIDIGCGDWQYMQHMAIPSEKQYTGYDIVPSVIANNITRHGSDNVHFISYDGNFETIPPGDLWVIKDVLQHLSNELILKFIENLKRSKIKYCLITNCYKIDGLLAGKVNSDITNGDFRPIDLTLPPFNLGMRLVLEYQGGGYKRTYLWSDR